MRDRGADLLLLATVLLWALNFTVSKYILTHGFHPLAYAGLRYGAAGVLFALVTLPWERTLRIGRSDVPLVLGCVALLMLNQVTFVYALRFTTAATVALLFGTLPIFTALLSSALGVERLSRGFWLASALSFAGVALVSLGEPGGLSADLKGDALAIVGALTWAGYSVAIASLMRRYSPFRLSGPILIGVSLGLLLLGSGQVGDQSLGLGSMVWLAFLFAVVGPLFFTNLTWFTALDRVGPSRATLFTNLQPFLAAVIALVVLSEPISGVQVAGGLAIAAGILLARRPGAAPAPADSPA